MPGEGGLGRLAGKNYYLVCSFFAHSQGAFLKIGLFQQTARPPSG
jgi:hypothetical protein